MREITLINPILYNTKYKCEDDKIDNDTFVSDKITLKRTVYKAAELVELNFAATYLANNTYYNFLETMQKRNIEISTEQDNFAEEVSKVLAGELKKDIITVIPATCGFGKSTIIMEYIKTLIEQYKNNNFTNGLIIATDRIKDLKEIQEELKEANQEGFAYLLESWNKDICKNQLILKDNNDKVNCCNFKNCNQYCNCKISKQQAEQKKYPILLITNARLREMGTDVKSYKKWNLGERQTLIIDEKPSILDCVRVDVKLLNQISTSISEKNYETAIEKTALENQFDNIRQLIIDKMQDLRENYKRFIVSNINNDIICKNDKTFMKLWKKYMKNEYKRELEHIHTVLTQGGFYIRDGANDKETEFITTINSKNLVDEFTGFKTIIFDGSSLYDPQYLKMYNNDNIKFLDTLNTKKYTNLKIIENNKHKLTKSNFNTKRHLIQACSSFINKKMEYGFNKAYVVTYQQYSSDIANRIKHKNQIAMLSENQCHYFGNTKGKNDMKDCNKMFMLGWETLPDYQYSIEFLSLVVDWEKTLKVCADKEVAIAWSELFEMKNRQITTINNVEFKSKKNYCFGLTSLNNLKHFKTLTNFYQEIFRTKLRNQDESEVEIEVFQTEKVIKEMIKELLKCNYEVNHEEIPEFNVAKDMSFKKKDGTMTDKQRIIDWFNKWDGKTIKVSEIRNQLNLTSKRWERLKQESSIKLILDSLTIPKKGYYCR